MATRRGGSSSSGWGIIGIFLCLAGLAGTGHVPQAEDWSEAFKNPPIAIPSSIAGNSGTSVPSSDMTMNAAAKSSALSSLSAIPTSGPTPSSPYSRDNFGQAWTDNSSAPGGHNGCDTRNDVLKNSLRDVKFRSGSNCVVESGVLEYDPYTGKRDVPWTKSNASALQVDHVVPLMWAWNHGASSWDDAKRTAYANDADVVLLLADGPANMGKGAKGPSEWMVPGNTAYRCTYAAKYVSIVQRYGLWLPPSDAAVLKKTLEGC